MVTSEQKASQNVCAPVKKIITPDDMISALAGLCESRFKAVSMYPSAKNARYKFDAVHLIRHELAIARLESNWKSKLKTCLRLERQLLFLAPTSTFKLYDTYVTAITSYMNACREGLNWRAQS